MKRLTKLFSVLTLISILAISLTSCRAQKLSAIQTSNLKDTLNATTTFTTNTSYLATCHGAIGIKETSEGYSTRMFDDDGLDNKFDYKKSTGVVTRTNKNGTSNYMTNVSYSTSAQFTKALTDKFYNTTNNNVYSINEFFPYVKELFLKYTDDYLFFKVTDSIYAAGINIMGANIDNEWLLRVIGDANKAGEDGKFAQEINFGYGIADESYYSFKLFFNTDFTEIRPQISIICNSLECFLFRAY